MRRAVAAEPRGRGRHVGERTPQTDSRGEVAAEHARLGPLSPGALIGAGGPQETHWALEVQGPPRGQPRLLRFALWLRRGPQRSGRSAERHN
ncbi:hypothetical protein NDU88_001563 [Pleurodeles waltl]|uniref:Uncharacterized protein n=1 Tax=Pleurodeles waltl TaxID=8319 RepID=A0AAV7WIN8_PLEWA|nr:hypothetical protein NDU88_001563 [Pleurodeles waltl]